MGPKTPSAELLKKYLSGQCSDFERKMVDTWYQSLTIASKETFSDADEEVLYERIHVQISETENAGNVKVQPLRKRWYYAAAAVVTLALLFTYTHLSDIRNTKSEIALTDSSQITFSNQEKKIIRYNLPDQSIVWLRPGAKVSHPIAFKNRQNREINFQGEAFFDIKRDVKHPFIIHCGKLKTQVLGTSFVVKARENDADYQVSVVTGSVAVSRQNSGSESETLVLKPKQKAVFERVTNKITLVTAPDHALVNENWQTVSLIFDETPMSEVANRLQQTFHIQIEFANPAIKRCRLKVDFNHQKLPEILGMIETLLGTTYEIEGSKVILKGEGCRNNG